MGKIGNVFRFYDQVKQEVGKITWPKKSELVNSTLMVMAVVVIFSLICLGVDYCINSIIQFLLKIGK
jgi:preprotein translocase subunit SecE